MKTLILLAGACFSLSAVAGEYVNQPDNIAEASRYVAQMKAREAARVASAPVAPMKLLAVPRFYKVGDRWVVAVSHKSYQFMRKMDTSNDDRVLQLDPRFYEFLVTKVDEHNQLATIQVREVTADNKPVVNPHNEKVLLVMDSHLHLLGREYFRKGAHAPIIVTSTGNNNVASGFDEFPLDLPDFKRAERSQLSALSVNSFQAQEPQTLLAVKQEHKIDPARVIHFDALDLLGRVVQIDWQRGDVWPARVQNTSSYSVLIAQELK